MPFIISPRVINEADIPYDKTLVALSISPIVVGEADIEATMNLTCTPYRVLTDGSIESRSDLAFSFLSGAVFAEAQTDPDLAVAAQAIWTAIQGYLTAKGV
jgi:hypothetical protein